MARDQQKNDREIEYTNRRTTETERAKEEQERDSGRYAGKSRNRKKVGWTEGQREMEIDKEEDRKIKKEGGIEMRDRQEQNTVAVLNT